MQHPVFRHPALTVRACEYGWGVFTTARLEADVLVESCPFLIVPEADTLAKPLCDYVFRLTNDKADPNYPFRVLALGWGGLFNHANEPNIQYSSVVKRRLLHFTTSRPVLAGEQLFVTYGAAWWNDRPKS